MIYEVSLLSQAARLKDLSSWFLHLVEAYQSKTGLCQSPVCSEGRRVIAALLMMGIPKGRPGPVKVGFHK